MNRPISVVYNNDIFHFTVDPNKEIVSILVSRGNCNAPYQTIAEKDLPPEAKERFYSRLVKGSYDV